MRTIHRARFDGLPKIYESRILIGCCAFGFDDTPTSPPARQKITSRLLPRWTAQRLAFDEETGKAGHDWVVDSLAR